MTSAFAAAEAAAPAKFISAKPAYARLAVTADASKVLLLAFDESAGTAKGYDTVYADVDLDGAWEVGEKQSTNDGALSTYSAYQPIVFPFGYNEFGNGKEALVLNLSRSAWQPANPEFAASFRVRLTRDGEDWEYLLRKVLVLSHDLEKAPVQHAAPLTVDLSVQQRGALGIAATLSAGEFSLNCYGPQGSPLVTLTVLDDAGKVQSEEVRPLNTLGYG